MSIGRKRTGFWSSVFYSWSGMFSISLRILWSSRELRMMPVSMIKFSGESLTPHCLSWCWFSGLLEILLYWFVYVMHFRAIHTSGMEDLLLYLASSKEENQFILHVLEIITLMFREQTSDQIACAGIGRSATEKERDERELIMAREQERAKKRTQILKYNTRWVLSASFTSVDQPSWNYVSFSDILVLVEPTRFPTWNLSLRETSFIIVRWAKRTKSRSITIKFPRRLRRIVCPSLDAKSPVRPLSVFDCSSENFVCNFWKIATTLSWRRSRLV